VRDLVELVLQILREAQIGEVEFQRTDGEFMVEFGAYVVLGCLLSMTVIQEQEGL
jgi:hypothetical protein